MGVTLELAGVLLVVAGHLMVMLGLACNSAGWAVVRVLIGETTCMRSAAGENAGLGSSVLMPESCRRCWGRQGALCWADSEACWVWQWVGSLCLPTAGSMTGNGAP